MPPKRKAPASSEPKARQSKLAKEHNITAQEETEIKEAWSLFSEKLEGSGEKEGVMKRGDVRRALIALDIPPTPTELKEYISILDPDSDGYTYYPRFLAICALMFHSREQTSEKHEQEVGEAWNLFISTGMNTGLGGFAERREEGEDRITMASLKRVAKALKEDSSEDLLRDMVLEANGGAGAGRGVTKEEFEGVMRRAGVWR